MEVEKFGSKVLSNLKLGIYIWIIKYGEIRWYLIGNFIFNYLVFIVLIGVNSILKNS